MENGNAQNIVRQLTLDEKLSLQTGDGTWNTKAIERVGLPSVTFSDGPLGVRHGKKAVSFPSVAKLACSFDEDVLREVGAAIGEQCRAQDIDVLLAPAINIKRNPRCGRNFEYFSEDPLLTAVLANAYITGVHSQGVGVCVKHFAANNQEYGRLVCDSVIDDKALNEIYLSAFKKVIEKSEPCCLMCGYNRLNGEYCSENKWLLNEVLRNKWGYKGVAVSDWGAVNNRVNGLKAGLDLEMPQGNVSKVKEAIEKGELEESVLDACVQRIVELATSFDRTARNVDLEYQHQLAGRVSADTTVLVKNNCGLLPFSAGDKIGVVGLFAKNPAFQGGGSSKVDAYKVDGLTDVLSSKGIDFEYAQGYNADGTTTDELIEQAQKVAQTAEKVVLVVGIDSDTEGKDRASWQLPQGQLKIIDAVTNVNSNVAAVIQCGSVADTSWSNSCKSILIDYYGGENDGEALYQVIFGETAPTGRLAETWADVPSALDGEFSADYAKALYKESIFVGYRYYTTANVSVAFPFGYGLSYNPFKRTNVKLSKSEVKPTDTVNVTLNVKNCGKGKDADVIQIYAENLDGRDISAKKKLVAFKKIRLKGGESKNVTIPVNIADLACYNRQSGKTEVNGGKYLLYIAENVNDENTVIPINVAADNNTQDASDKFPFYYNLDENFCPSDEQFISYYGKDLRQEPSEYDASSPLCKIQKTKFGSWFVKKIIKGLSAEDTRARLAMPLRSFENEYFSSEMEETLLNMLNGNFFKNLFKFLAQSVRFKKVLKKQKKEKQ